MLMGEDCTRGCRFCSVNTARNPGPLDDAEPDNIARTIHEMGLDYVVLTSVNRDDLPDQGAGHFSRTIQCAHRASPELLIEVLIPDFMGEIECVQTVIDAATAAIGPHLEHV